MPNFVEAPIPAPSRTTGRRERATPDARAPIRSPGVVTATVIAAIIAVLVLTSCSSTSARLNKENGYRWPPASSSTLAPDSPSTTDNGAPGVAPTSATTSGRVTAPTTPDAEPTTEESGNAPRSDTRKPDAPRATKLGNLDPPPTVDEVGAPYDPCRVVTWNDFPPDVRPRTIKPRRPRPAKPAPGSDSKIGCVFDGSSAGHADTEPALFTAYVAWGALELHPEGSKPQKIDGADGSVTTATTTKGTPLCRGVVALADGVAGVSLINGRTDPAMTCEIVTTLLTRIAQQHA